MIGLGSDKKQDHIRMNVAPDQIIILGVWIFLDHSSLSLIDQKILMSLDTFHNSQDFMSRNPALNQFERKKHTSEREKIGMTRANMTIIRKCYYRESCSRRGWLMELGGLPFQSQLTTSLKERSATFSSKKKFDM